MNKRGVSPLIATVMIIGFTIAMAGIVSTFIIRQTKETFNPENLIDDSSLCDQMSLGVYVPKPEDLIIEQSTTAGSNLYYLKGVALQNKGSYAVRGFVVSPAGMAAEIQYNFDKRINKRIVDSDMLKETGLVEGKSGEIYYLPPGKMFTFGSTGIPIGNEKNYGKETKIKVYPIIFDPETGKGVKCVKGVLVFDYREICNSYGKTNPTCNGAASA